MWLFIYELYVNSSWKLFEMFLKWFIENIIDLGRCKLVMNE